MASKKSGRKTTTKGKSKAKAKGRSKLTAKSQKSVAKKVAKILAKTGPGRLRADALTDVWPSERDIFFRPERLKYVRKLVEPKGCVFCAAARTGPSFESLVLFKGETAMVVMNKYPYNNGHLLIIPLRHEGEFTELKKAELYELQDLLKKSIKILKKVYQPAGFNVGLNLGAAAGAGIPEHLHTHVVPRWRGDTNFFPLLAETKVVVETLEQTYERLLPYFERDGV